MPHGVGAFLEAGLALDRAAVEELAGLGFIDRQQDLVITGKPGTGKSHILMSIALRACEAGHLVRYARFVDLLTELHAGLADGSYERRLRRWARFPLIVLDDVGLGPVPAHGDSPTAAHMLWSLIDLRHQRSPFAAGPAPTPKKARGEREKTETWQVAAGEFSVPSPADGP